MNEIWKDVVGYEGLYKVSSSGHIMSLKRKDPLILQPRYNRYGYLYINLYKSKRKTHCIHRLVGEAFIPNPSNLPQINHKNGIKDDNNFGNLEWETASGNIKHTFKVLGRTPVLKPVGRYNQKELIEKYESMSSASKLTGINLGDISMACGGKLKTAGGFIWKRLNS